MHKYCCLGDFSMEKKQIITVIASQILILLFLVVVGSAFVISPFFGDINVIDEGQYAAWVNHMLHGKLPYRDIYIPYGPLLIYPPYLLSEIFGPSVVLIRFVVITVGAYFGVLVMRLFAKKIGFSGVMQAIFVILILFIPGVHIRQAIGLLTLLFLMQTFENRSWRFGLVTGGLLSISFLVSSEIGIAALVISIIYILYILASVDKIRSSLGVVLSVFSGAALIGALFTFVAMREGWFWAYLVTTHDALTSFSGMALPNGKNFPDPFALFPEQLTIITLIRFVAAREMLLYWELLFLIAGILYAAISFILKKSTEADGAVLLVSIYGLMLYTTLIGRSGHHLMIFPILLLLGLFFSQKLFHILKKPKIQRIEKFVALSLLGIMLLFLFRVLYIFHPHYPRFLSLPEMITAEKNNLARVGPVYISESQKGKIESIQSFVSRNTDTSDTVFFFSNEPVYYFLTDRVNPTRYDLPYMANTLDKRYEVLRDLTLIRPKYIFINTNAWAVDEVSNERRLPEVVRYIKRNYKKVATLDGIVVYGLQAE